MKKRSIKTVILTALLSLSLLSGCGSKESSDTSSRQQNTISTVQSSSTENVTSTGTETTEHSSGKSINDPSNLISSDTLLYDITDMLPEKDSKEISDVAVRDDVSLLVLYQSKFSQKSFYYSIEQMDTVTGKTTSLYEDIEIPSDDYTVNNCSLSFVSIDPLILYNSETETFLIPSSASVLSGSILEEYNVDRVFSYNGTIYCTTSSGPILQLSISEESLSGEIFWDAPKAYKMFYLCGQNGSVVTLMAYPVIDNYDGKVFFDVDISSGKLISTYTIDSTTNQIIARTSSSVARISYSSPTALVLTKDGSRQYTLSPSGSSDITSYFADGNIRAKAGYFSLSDQGFFFLAGNKADKYDHVLYWDLTNSEPSVREETHTPYEITTVTKEKTIEYAQELSSRFGINIILDGSDLPYISTYNIIPESDYTSFYKVLSLLDECYSHYPDGFFNQLRMNGVPLRVCLVYNMVGTGSNTVNTAAGLASYDQKGYYFLLSCFNKYTDTQTVYHETTHLIYNHLLLNGVFTENEAAWTSLNPPDFKYTYDYGNLSWDDTTYTCWDSASYYNLDNAYFCSPYSKTYETEDIATLMGYLMEADAYYPYYAGIHMQEKCKYFFNLIRQGFDTTGWPEKTFWEDLLDKVAQ